MVLLSTTTMPAVAAESADDAIGAFEVTRYEVVGDALLGAAPIATLLAPYTGRARTFADVQRAMESLEDAYRSQGFSVVKVSLPEQELNQGTVRLVVAAARIGKVQVVGNTHFDSANIRASVPGLVEGKAPNITRISASLRTANENPAKKTVLTLQSAGSDDEVNATLQVVDEKPWAAGLTLDNAGTDKTGKTQISAQLQHFNVAGLDHTLSLQYTTTVEQPGSVHVYGVGYHVPLYAWGDSLDLYGSYSDVDSGLVSTGAFNLLVSGKGTVLGGRYNHNLARRGNYESRLLFGWEQKAYQNNLGYQGFQLGSDVTVRPLSLTYAGDWSHGAGGSTNYYLTGVRNVAGGDRGSEADFTRIRAGAATGYGLLRYGIGHTQVWPSDWQLRVLLNGQWTQDALVPGEQFGAGGATSVRGYGERALADDQGRVANLELYTPGLCSGGALQCRLLAFVDTGSVTRNNPLPGERRDASITSAGIGVRAAVGRQWSMQMDVAQVLADSDAHSKGDTRVHLKMNLAY